MRMDDQPPIDGVIEVVTPENIMIHYRAAGPYRRVLAFAIDITLLGVTLAIMWMAIGFVATSLGVGSGLGSGLGLVGMFILWWGWCAIQEAMWNGRTLGKMATGLRVLTIDGQPIQWSHALLRGLMQGIDLSPPITGYIVMAMNDRYQRLGDWAAGTIVIKEDRQWLMGVAKIDDPRAIQLAAYLPPDLEVSKTLAKALATYVERRRFFMATRRSEIARHLGAPLLRQFGLPPDTSHDLLLCAMYYRTFIGDHKDDERHAAAVALATQAVGTPAWGMYGGQPGLAYSPMAPAAPWQGGPVAVGMSPHGPVWPQQHANHPDGTGIVFVNPPGSTPAASTWSASAPQQGGPR